MPAYTERPLTVRSILRQLVTLVVASALFLGCGGDEKPKAAANKSPAGKNTAAQTDGKTSEGTKAEGTKTEGTAAKTNGAAKTANGNGADTPAEGGVAVDPALPSYTAAVGVSGSLNTIGSDTMNNLMTLWQEDFQKFYPAVKVSLSGAGSNTAIKGLAEGASAFGPMSRDPKQDEIEVFEKKFGYKPTVIPTSIDMLAIYVHKDNPIKELTFEQIDAIFSSTRKLGYEKDIATWGDLGLEGEWKDAPISIYGRNSASGTYVYLKEHVLGKGDYKTSVKENPGSPAVVQAVSSDKFGIGYSGIGVKTSDVRAVPLARKAGAKAFPAEAANGYSGDYPLSRPLLLALNYEPNKELDPLRREFLRYVLSKQGQEVVVKDGFLPLTAEMAAKAREMVGLKDD